MKRKILFVSIVLSALMACFTSCSKDKDDDNTQTQIINPVVDAGTMVSGTYVGKLTISGEVIEDVYVVKISRINSQTVSVKADFFESGVDNFTVNSSNGQYMLQSANHPNMTIYVNGKTLNINYLSAGGWMVSYVGKKD